MIHADRRFSEAVEAAVAELERTTDAEVVVVAAERSGSYRDLALAVGAAGAFAVFAGILALPWPVHPLFALADVAAAYLVCSWWAAGSPLLLRLASATRQEEQVRHAAAAEFHVEAVHATPRRTGLLIYVSAWERRVELIPDVGLEARIPKGRWAEVARAFDTQDIAGFVNGLQAAGRLLAEHVPHVEGQRVDLANAPRIRA